MPKADPHILPIFPLPGAVLLPHSILPLRVFEPRYRLMLKDVLEGDHLVVIGMLRDGFEPLYHTLHAPVYEYGGLGKVIAAESVEDGQYNILLRGEGRARIVEEIKSSPYRRARVDLMAEIEPLDEDEVDALRMQIRAELQAAAAPNAMQMHWTELFEAGADLGDLTDLIAGALPGVPELRQRMLEELDVVARATILLSHIRTLKSLAARNSLSFNHPSCN